MTHHNALKLSDLRPAFEKPDRLTDITSWHGHIPFAFYLVQVLGPRVFVELGTHRGDSYCAFCQAVQNHGIDCKCFAVDTWKGDGQAGFYDEEIFEEFRKYHDPRHGRFSTLIRSSFDEALSRFAEGEIDLLHIDGCHRYEAVKHDFESWLPKMSPAGVVLLHDTRERQGRFGVWKLWDELSPQYPHVEFYHSHGLGLAVVGTQVPLELAPLVFASEEDMQIYRSFFEALGDNLILRGKLKNQSRVIENLDSMLTRHRKMVLGKNRQIENLEGKIQSLETKLRNNAP